MCICNFSYLLKVPVARDSAGDDGEVVPSVALEQREHGGDLVLDGRRQLHLQPVPRPARRLFHERRVVRVPGDHRQLHVLRQLQEILGREEARRTPFGGLNNASDREGAIEKLLHVEEGFSVEHTRTNAEAFYLPRELGSLGSNEHLHVLHACMPGYMDIFSVPSRF